MTIQRTAQQTKNLRTWIRALRSGKYKQAQEALCTHNPVKGTDAYCCLGVAADVVVGGTWDQPTYAFQMPYDEFNWRFTSKDNKILGETDILPQETLDDLFGPGLILDQLTAMNDGTEWYHKDPVTGWTVGESHMERKRGFRGIAQHIERVTGVKA